MPKTKDQREWKQVTGGLPPMLILGIAEKAEGQIVQVDEVESKDKKGKVVEDRKYYRVMLEGDASGMNAAKQQVTYKSGQIITIPGSGFLDSALENVVRESQKKSKDDEINIQDLVGFFIQVERKPDEKIQKGRWKGKTAKMYHVAYAPAEK